MIKHRIKRFVLRQKGYKDTPIIFMSTGSSAKNVGYGRKIIWICLVDDSWHSVRVFDNADKNNAYKAWGMQANSLRLNRNAGKPFIMSVKE